MIAQTAEYALRAMVILSRDPAVPQTTQALSTATRVPVPYLHKVLRRLADAGLLQIVRGRHGGFVLARSPASLHLLDVVDAVAPIEGIAHCPLGLRGHAHDLCPLHQRLDRAIRNLREEYRATTLAEIAAPHAGIMPLCDDSFAGPV
ncbi:MAG: RrF2 family transcriptional regulator [Planctomycetota bacterium]